jgi:predicted transcriptional regulator
MASSASSARDLVLEIVRELPEDSSFDEILQELVFNRMIERGLADVDAGRTITSEEMARTIDSWARE